MNAHAVSRREQEAASVDRIVLKCIAALALVLVWAGTAGAQIAGSVSVDSNYLFRGYSLSNDRPGLVAQISYDHPSGAYFSLSGLSELGSHCRFLGLIGNAGFAARLNQDFTVDAGIIRAQIGAASSDRQAVKYTEVYMGGYVGPVSGRIYYSTEYRKEGQATLYGEIEAAFEPRRNWRVSGHVGLLTYLGSSPYARPGQTHGDARITVGRQFGKVEVHTAVSTKTTEQYDRNRTRQRLALTLGASLSF